MTPMDPETRDPQTRGLADEALARAEAAGSSLQEAGRAALEELTAVIRHYPVHTLLIGIAAGYALSKLQQKWREGDRS